jgi:hypothetical protein
LPKKKYKYPHKTTVWLKRSTIDALKKLGRKGDSYDSVIQRLIHIAEGEVDIFVDVLSVDGGDPRKHRIVLQLGDFIYAYEQGKFTCLRRPTGRTGHKVSVGAANR